MARSKQWKKTSRDFGRRFSNPSRSLSSKKFLRLLLLLAFLAVIPPFLFHYRLRRLHEMQLQKCGWLDGPPLVCAHGGDASKAVPNTMGAYRAAILDHVDCIEIDISRSSDGVLFSLHDRDLQRMLGNASAKVGYLSESQIRRLDASASFQQEFNQEVPSAEDALLIISKFVKQVILDVKVGPPLYEEGLAADVLSIIAKAQCKNCLVWAKSDLLGRDVIKLSPSVPVGYIVMIDPSTGVRTNLLRMKNAKVAGVYHPLINEKLVRVVKSAGKKVYAWTVDDEESMLKMLQKRVDAIVTSNPTLLQLLMQDVKSQCVEEGFALP
ncbi:glycerophosphodiester phosphodiesterase GDPD4 isoform X1 [Aristolochia californica]|uniref:glycerophosphodiester phosphodiesterase GDPD4 isoform X1 n=1 Tax=Aristolochia californica TaxID=171875 RepID=UPI0035E2E484